MTASSVVVSAPTFEHLTRALGVGTPTPRISWTTQAPPGWSQHEYQIEVRTDARAPLTHTVTGPDQVLVPWPAAALHSRQRSDVRVRVRPASGSWSDWSPTATVEAGLLRPEDWSAQPVGAPWQEQPRSLRRPCLVRREFRLDKPIARARLYASAHGLYQAEINGRRVGNDTLSPGWTAYHARLRYYTYDVTTQVQLGDNAIGAWLGDGWYRGRIGFLGGHQDLYGTDLSFIGQLEVTHTDGSRTTVATDPSWSAGTGPIHHAGLYEGEKYDARDVDPDWSRPQGAHGGWVPVRVTSQDPNLLVAPSGPPVTVQMELPVRQATPIRPGTWLLDFGQNLVGRLKVRVRGERGDTVRIRHAEVLQDGELYTRPLRGAVSTDEYTLAGTGTEVWEPRFTIHGFRYAEISGWPGSFDPTDVTACVYHTGMRRTGSFACSDPLLNRLHENIVWSTRGNFVDLPTDCPQRDERLGWTGDIQVFAPTASFLFDCAGLLTSWLRDVSAEQLPDGTVPWYVPVIPGGVHWTPIQPGAAWGDVAVLTPWTLYQRFGDTGVLRTQYESAKKWVDLIDRLAGPSHLWNTGMQLGDWLDPIAPPDDPAAGRTDRYLVATAYFAWSAHHLAETASVIGQAADAEKYRQLAAAVRTAFRGAYLLPDGRLTSDSATAYALAIMFDLLATDQQRQAAGDRLAELVRSDQYRISTGFVGTPLVCDALTQTGHLTDAYGLLTEQECPSWLYTVLQGGTTIWERWDSMMPDGTINPGEMTSFNHYALGAVADWMHRVIGGLAPMAPGYREVLIRPQPGAGITHATTRHDSPYGPIDVAWRINGSDLTCAVKLPTGVAGWLQLPGGEPEWIGSGTHTRTVSAAASAA